MLTDTGGMAGQPLYMRITLVAPLPGVLYSLQGAAGAPVGHVMSSGADLSLDVSVDFVKDTPGVARDGGPSCATVRPLDGWRRLPA